MKALSFPRSSSQSDGTPNEKKFALIGAGPAGLSGARNLKKYGIPFVGFEAHSDVGGLWDIENPRSTVYESAHLISSKKKTEFHDFPMPEEVAFYPHHSEMKAYFRAYARHFGLYEHYQFQKRVTRVEPEGALWRVTLHDGQSALFRGVIIANGTLSEPHIPEFPGSFSGEMLHSSQYKSPDIFEGKRVLIIGAGNSGCDIAVDAVHRTRDVHISLRRGYHFVPKFAFGKPADTVGGTFTLPPFLKQKLDTFLVRLVTGPPERYGFPTPDHKLYESHPIVNSLVLHYAGHGDLKVRPQVLGFSDKSVRFVDGSESEFDLVLMATGYLLHYPFIDPKHLNWHGLAPELYLNIFHPIHNNLFVLGMVEATGLGWQGRSDQAELVCRFIRQLDADSPAAHAFIQKKKGPPPATHGGYHYLELQRMSYYVHKDTYLKLLARDMKMLGFPV